MKNKINSIWQKKKQHGGAREGAGRNILLKGGLKTALHLYAIYRK